MKVSEVRQKYLQFFEKKGHKIIPAAPLVLENDPTTLFTSSGMQPLVPFLMGQTHPDGKRLVDSQPSIRVQDIDEVGDNRHTTFFEMLGNWSLGDYFKKEQLGYVLEFLTQELGLDKEKLYVSVFEGNDLVPKDTESVEIWQGLGIATERIFFYDVKKNWWSRSGTPEQMPVGEIGGPDSEIFFDFGKELNLHESSQWKAEKCHPNCDCGRFVEIGNSVFIQYVKQEDGSLKELPQKNVDFGGGLERLTAAVNNDPDVFKIDVLKNVVSVIEEFTQKKYEGEDIIAMRIITDHLRAACFLIASGVVPANKLQGYVLRRLIRRAVFRLRELGFDIADGAISTFVKSLHDDYELIEKNWYPIKDILNVEAVKFAKTLEKGMKEAEKISIIDAKKTFDLYQTYGFPLELTVEMFKEKGQDVDIEEFRKEFVKHQDKSRTAAAGMFKGGLGGHSEMEVKLHTATHLLHSALRKILGTHVSQKGSNITEERLRFDFSHSEKLTEEQIKQVEDLVNDQIAKKLVVTKVEMPKQKALDEGALAFFPEKYPEITNVYTIGDEDNFFSKELCGGPHVTNLTEIGGRVNIYKEESAGAGVRRIYARILLDTSN